MARLFRISEGDGLVEGRKDHSPGSDPRSSGSGTLRSVLRFLRYVKPHLLLILAATVFGVLKFIAHRLSTVVHADAIIVLERGV